MVAAAVLACILLLFFATTDRAQARYSPKTAVSDLNQMRLQSGMPRVSGVRRTWNRGCRLHNRYMRRTGNFGHYEDRGSRYYTRAGASAAARSVISEPSQLPSVAFGDTIYHRLAMLQPRLRAVGYSSSSGFTCMNVMGGVSNHKRARLGQTVTYAWPADGMTGVDPVFDDIEFPDPKADAPGADVLGTPITGSVNGPWKYWQMAKSTLTMGSLVSELGQVIPVSLSDAGSPNGQFLQGGFALLPRRGLPADTWFTATASGYVTYRGARYPFSLSTRFRTGADGR